MPIYVSANRFLVIDSRGIEPLLNFFLEPSIFVNFNSIWNCIFYHFSFPFFLSMNDEFSFLFNFRNNGLILTMKRLLFFKFLFFMREKKKSLFTFSQNFISYYSSKKRISSFFDLINHNSNFSKLNFAFHPEKKILFL